jgi:hypothetical protein
MNRPTRHREHVECAIDLLRNGWNTLSTAL